MVTSLRKSAKQNLYMIEPATTNVVQATHETGHLHPHVITGTGHKVVFTVEVRNFLKPCKMKRLPTICKLRVQQLLKCCIFFFIKDTQRPSFGETCPPERNVVADEGKTTATVSWGPIEATDNEHATVTVLPDVTSPHNFSEGSHTVIYTASDPSGNTEICQFRVNVQGNIIRKKICSLFRVNKKAVSSIILFKLLGSQQQQKE